MTDPYALPYHPANAYARGIYITGHRVSNYLFTHRYTLPIILLYVCMSCACSTVLPKYIEPDETNFTTIEGSTRYYIIAYLKNDIYSIDNAYIYGSLPYRAIKISPGQRFIIVRQARIFSFFPEYTLYKININAETNHKYVARGHFWSKPRTWIEDCDNTAIRWDSVE